MEADKEENDVLGDALYNYSELLRKRYELNDLYRLLIDYLGNKGLSQSLLKPEELVSLITSDISLIKESIDNTKETIEGIKKIIK